MLKRHETIIEGFRDFLDKSAFPAPLPEEHSISKSSEKFLIFNEKHHGLTRIKSGAALGFLGRVVHEDLYKHVQEGMERVQSAIARASKIEADNRFRREESEKFIGIERGKVLHPELDVTSAFESARPAIEAGEKAAQKFEHAQALTGKASEGNK